MFKIVSKIKNLFNSKINRLYTILAVLLGLFIFTQCDTQNYRQGERLYKSHCANCHMEDGQGLKSLIPPLANASYLKDYKETIPCIIRNGIKGPIFVNDRTYDQEMVGIPQLNDVEINNIINYINHSWGNDFGTSNILDVQANLKNCQ